MARRGAVSQGEDEKTLMKVIMPARLLVALDAFADQNGTIRSRVVRAAVSAYIGVDPMAEPEPTNKALADDQ